ncbi:MAG TPA: hypothetical protein VLV83_07100 [Acidobacteriota bacterium]|nr:hypothetical protein [Acidobacteriota bacterium]
MPIRARQVSMVIIALVMLSLPARAQSRQSYDQRVFFARRAAALSFENTDLAPLIQAGRARNPGMEDVQLEQVILSNMRFLFHNQLNRSRFMVVPHPRLVVEKITEALDSGRRLHQLAETVRSLEDRNDSTSRVEAAQSIRTMEQEARRIRNIFRSYFREHCGGDLLIEYGGPSAAEGEYSSFLRQAEPLIERLDERMADYFLKAPSVIEASDFDNHSVAVLSEALVRLSRMALRKPDRGDSAR